MLAHRPTKKMGFTLIELLVVIVILATLSTVVFVALNPTKRFADSRNARRFNDVNSIMTAVQQYAVDNDGALPSAITTSEQQLGDCTTGGDTLCAGAAAGCADLSASLSAYLKSMPFDPQTGSSGTTAYSIVKNSNNMVTVKACSAEDGEVVEVSR